MVTKENKKVLGGSWLLLTLLMIGMSWAQAVPPASDAISTTSVDEAEANEAVDQFALNVEEYETVDYTEFGYAAEDELVGSRTATSKTYVTDEGKVAIVATDPIHYLDDEGVWQEVDLNIESEANGWSVTENAFDTYFEEDVNNGVLIQVDENIDAIRMGINPVVVQMHEAEMPMMYKVDETEEPVQTAGNVLRYPLGQGIALDYTVTGTQVKQNLVIRDQPFFETPDFTGWFGLQEEMLLPHGYAVFDGSSALQEGQVLKTNETFEIRNVETGELLVSVPTPQVYEADMSAIPAIGQYYIMQIGEHVQITTMIDSEWLMDENRSYPIMIDPTIDVTASTTYYTYKYVYTSRWGSTTYEYGYATSYISQTCKGNGNAASTCTSSSYYRNYLRTTVHRFNLANTMPTGATITGVDYENHVGRYRTGSRSFEVSVMKSGSSQSSTMIDPASYTYSGGRYIHRYAANSADSSSATSLSDPGYYYGYNAGSIRSISMNSNGESDVQDAVDGNGAGSSGNILGLAVRNTNNAPFWYWCTQNTYTYYGCQSSSSYKPHLEISYTGGSDTAAPLATHSAFDGKTTYLEGSRTMFMTALDASGVNTTSAGKPHLYYRVDSGSWTGVGASTIGTCVAGLVCNFKATIPAQTAPATGTTEVEYYWAYRDSPAPPNGGVSGTTGTTPAGGTGIPSNMQTHPSSPYSYEIESVDNAADGDNKWQIKATGWNSYSFSSAVKFYDWQMTYYEPSREYLMEYDTSDCGVGRNSCFNALAQLDLRYYPGTTRVCTSTTCQTNMDKVSPPGVGMLAEDGPGSDIIWYHDGTSWGVMLYDVASGTGIDSPQSAGTVYNSLDYGSTDDGYVKVPIPGDITGYFGAFSWNSTYNLNSANRNLFCINTNNNPIMFVRSTYSGATYTNPCYGTYYYYQYNYAWNGWSNPGYDGRVSNDWQVNSKVSSIKPQPDTFPPEFDHPGLMDSYVDADRTLKFEINDAGDPPMGLNTNSSDNGDGLVGPSMTYRIWDADASTPSWSAWTSRVMTPDASRASCVMNTCQWTTTIPGTDRGNTVEYKLHAVDNNGNWNNTTAYSYTIGTPTKIFVIEWHDMTAGFNSAYNVNFQVRLYDVTNEVEFAYDTSSNAYYDYQYIGFQNQAATTGELLRSRGAGFLGGQNPFSDNYRIATDGSDFGYETYTAGMTELYNYNEEFTGSNNGNPYTYYCTRYFTQYRNDCSTVIDLPAGFEFEYFGTTYDGDQGHKIHAIRHGAMQFSTSSTTNSAQMMSSGWGTTMPGLPNSGTYVRNIDLAPWWGYYTSYYCYYNSASECSIRTKTIPFDGAGMDVNADITTPTIWDIEQSPIRVNPSSGDWLSVSADLTIMPGVEVQIADGKGLAFTGMCNTLTVDGNATHPVTITNMGTTYAQGLAFTNGGCAGGTDDRHTFTHTNFVNLTTAISAGSRNGAAPHYNGNVGNFTMSDTTFTNVGTAIKHGSGQGTAFDLSGVDISNSADSCVDLPDDATLTWVGGSASDCNTHAYTGQGAVLTGDGSTIWIENVDFDDAAVNGIIGEADSLSLSNVTIDASSGFSWQQTGTGVAQTSTATSGTDAYFYNVDINNYLAALTTHATDSLHMEDVTSTGDSNGYTVTPAGASSPAIGATGWTLDGLEADGGLTMARTQPSSLDNVDLGGALQMSGTAPSTDLVTGNSVTAEGLTINGCGWRVDLRDVTLGSGGTNGAWVTGSCTSSASSNVITVGDGTMSGNNNNNNFVYARNSVVTLAEMTVTGQTAWGSNLASASTNGDIRLIDVNFRGNDCLDSSNSANFSACWVETTSNSAKVYYGGTGTVSVYRSGNSGNAMQPNHNVAASVHDSTGTELFQVGTSKTDSSGNANVWLVTDLFERDSNGNTVNVASYTDHTLRASGGAGQNVTTPTDPWYTADHNPDFAGQSDLPLEVGGHVYLSLEAFPMDFGGATKDCTFFSTNDSASSLNGYYTYTRQIITLSADMVLDGCSVHLQGTSLRMNVSSGSNPTITLRNGAELLISEWDGDFGHIKAQSSTYPWSMDLANNGQLTIDAGSIRDMNGGLSVGDGGTLEMRNGSTAYGSPNAAASTATIDVDGGTMIVNNAVVQNVNSGIGVRLTNTAASSLSNILVKNSAVGIDVTDAAPTIDGFTLTDNTVGMNIDGGMSLPTLYRSTILSGQSAGWTTHAIDITSFAKNNNYVQIGTNIVYGGGNSDPARGSYYGKYFMTTDRWRIAVDDGDGNGLTNVTDSSVTGYYPYSAADPASGVGGVATYDGGRGGQPVWDCNLYGYRYNPGGSYQYAYYYYFIQYGGGAYTMNGNYNNEPNEFGFRIESADGVTANTNYYPYMYWGSYWPSFYHGGTNFAPPEGFNGLWNNYNVCQNYAYGPSTPVPAGYRLAYPIVDTSSSNIDQVVMYVDMVHYGADYYQDRLDISVRAGSTVSNLLSADYSRDFGTADISNGAISGADTGIDIGGDRASGALTNITITNPSDEGVFVSGSTGATMDQITVDGGRYGVRMGSNAGGKLVMSNVDLDGQSLDGLVLSKTMNMELSGTIQNAGNCGLKVLPSNDGDWEFDGLTVSTSTKGLCHNGAGLMTMSDTTMSGNTLDVMMSGTARMDYLEGDVTESKVTTNGASKFTRLRGLEVQITADGSGVDGAPVKILDADNMVVASGSTDSSGDVNGLSFITWSKDASGVTTPNLAGYQMVTIATIAYTSGSVIDARYAMNTISLSDTSGNSASAALTATIDARTCYTYSSTSYDTHAACTGMNYRSSRTVDGVLEIGYYNSRSDMKNMVIQMDSPYNYADIGTGGQSFNGSTVLVTGCVNSQSTIYPVYPYQGHMYMDDTLVIAMCDESGNKAASSFRLGYSGTYSYGNYHINNSALLGLKSIATGSGYYQNNGDLEVTNSLLVHYDSLTNIANGAGSVYYDDMCIQTSGFDDVEISGNEMVNCGVGVFVPNNFYATSPTYNGNGQHRLDVSNNVMEDCVNLCMWFYLGSNSHDAMVNGNTMSSLSGYTIYSQDNTLYDIEIDGNTLSSENPIYMRGAREWTVTGNDITGDSNAAHACIFMLNGHGTIEGNTCTDADGGIAISGIRTGNDVHINSNTIGFTAGRLPTSAVGIFVENCGLDEIFMEFNSVSTVMNAVNTDGCKVTDNNSVYQGLGGGAGRIHSVDIQQSTYSPSHLTSVCTGDSVRWTSRAYGSTNTPHTTTSDSGQAESWNSGTMNLGSSFVHQFTNVGNFTYYSASMTTMTGSVNVADCQGNNLQTTGYDVLGGGDDITLNGVAISGYGLGLAMDGGSLHLAGSTVILGDATAVEVTNVDVSTNGASVAANGTYGVGLKVVSESGYDDLDLTGLSVNAAVGVIADGHDEFRWNGGIAQGHTVLKTANGASGTIENMSGIFNHPVYGDVPASWLNTSSCYSADPTWIMTTGMGSCGGVATQINAGAFSTVTSIGNGVLNNGSMISPLMPSKLTVHADAIVHEGNLLSLTILHDGANPTSDVGLYIRSLAMATNQITGEQVAVPGGRAEYVSPSWRSSPGRTITVDGVLWDWLGSNMANDADDMMPGAVAVNATTQAHMRVTWDSNYMFIALVGPTFSATDGLFYLDTAPGGSSTGDNWHSQHTLPIKADYMLWMEDLNNWGLRKVMPTGNWVDVTSSCPQITSHIAMDPTVPIPLSEFRVPWSCLGNPTESVRWIAMVQWDSPYGLDGQVAGVFPDQPYNGSTTSGQTFGQFGNFNLVGGDLPADGLSPVTLDDHLLLLRSYVGTGSAPGDPHAYQILVKTRNSEGDYWDWDDSNAPVVMSTNQNIAIDILRAKPIIENLVDVEYDEDSGTHTISLTDKGSDHQDSAGDLTWTVTDAASNTHSYPTPYDYSLANQDLTLNTLENQFGGHRLQLTVTDSHGLSATQTMEVGIWNVNDAPVICNTNRFDCMPVFYDDGDGNLNVHDENFNGLITKELGDTSNASRSYIVDMGNEQTQTDWNNEAVPQVYTWTENEGTCTNSEGGTIFTTEIDSNVLTIEENTNNEAGGDCDIVLSLTDNANANANAGDVSVNFIVNPVNDQPVLLSGDAGADFNAAEGIYVETANGSLQLDWFWDVMEDDDNPDNLQWDLSRLMSDNDHPLSQLTWDVEETSLCSYDNYFTITVDNDFDTLSIDLIDDAATDAPTSEIDFLQDADNNGVADGGVHQMQPASGVYCTVYLWLNDTAEAPSHIDYAQSPSGVYEQRSIRETIYIRVINTPEARADYNFVANVDGETFDWQNVKAVLPGTRIPVDVVVTNTGDEQALYNYPHDLQVNFYVDDNPTVIQDQITLSWDAGQVPDVGETETINAHVTINNPSKYVRAFIEVRTINPHTNDYIIDDIRRPQLEELNWDNNNLTTTDTAEGLPQMVRLRPATSVASFAPGLMAVSLVGAFVGALLMGSRREEDEEELMESLSGDDEAVSPVIATILLVAITVVLSGVIYVWANSLATDSTGKATPRLTFNGEAMFEHTGDETLWNWKISVISHDNELAAQAVYVIVQWTDDAGDAHSERTNLANPNGVYGFAPSNSPDALVTYKDSINCAVDCSAGFGASDVIHVRMTDPASGEPIEQGTVTLQYAPAGGTAVILMTWDVSYNPPSMKAIA